MSDSSEEWFGFENVNRRKKEAGELYEQAKTLVKDKGEYALALKKLREANKLYPLRKYSDKIEALVDFMKNEGIPDVESHTDEPTENTGNFETLASGLKVRKDLHNKLYGYQVEGVNWLHRHFRESEGCILADDMGLGKTIQTIALLASLFESKSIRHALIVAPTTLLLNWGKEFHAWAPEVKIFKFDGSLQATSRLRSLLYVQEEGGVILSTYDLCRNYSEQMSSCRGCYFVWDYLILDEGHKIKNATKTTKNIHEIPARNRLILTGTPLQNNLRELWSLYDFVMKGTLLGTYRTFKMKFETPIMRGREKDARSREIIQGRKTAETLRQIYSPYFLRRTKNQIFKGKNSAVTLPGKIDWVIWIYLSDAQISVYRDFLNSEDVKQLILQANMKSALVSLLVLKKICDHPRLLSQHVCNEVLNNSNISIDNIDEAGDVVSIDNVSDYQLIKESSKLSFCLYLLEKLKSDGHKTILFSQSTKMLDIIQKILVHRNWKLSRLDGRISNMRKRDEIVRAFQVDPLIPLCLLTSQVGGVGLTLTSADRVIIYDPCWNPATDSQAIDRAYRIGQQREVVVYRLVSCGTVEEKIYKRQIFKDSITKQTVGAEQDPTRYFSGADLRQLFEFSDPKASQTFELINEMHGSDNNYSETIISHLQSVKNSSDVLNVHDHSVLFSNEEPEIVEEIEVIDLIDSELKLARENLDKESLSTKQILVESGVFARPFQLHVTDKRSVKKPDTYVPLDNPSEVIEIGDSHQNSQQYFSFVEEFSDCLIIDDDNGSLQNGIECNEGINNSETLSTSEAKVTASECIFVNDDSISDDEAMDAINSEESEVSTLRLSDVVKNEVLKINESSSIHSENSSFLNQSSEAINNEVLEIDNLHLPGAINDESIEFESDSSSSVDFEDSSAESEFTDFFLSDYFKHEVEDSDDSLLHKPF